MSNQTKNKGLNLPISTERYSIEVFNKNYQIIDDEFYKLDKKNNEQDNNLSKTQINLDNHKNNKENPHEVSAFQLGLGNVENKSSEQIREEITNNNVIKALGYTPYTPNQVDNKLSVLENKFGELKKYVADGKELLASAISAKGVESACTDSFETLSDNISKIGTVSENFKAGLFITSSGNQSATYPIPAGATTCELTVEYQISQGPYPLLSILIYGESGNIVRQESIEPQKWNTRDTISKTFNLSEAKLFTVRANGSVNSYTFANISMVFNF